MGANISFWNKCKKCFPWKTVFLVITRVFFNKFRKVTNSSKQMQKGVFVFVVVVIFCKSKINIFCGNYVWCEFCWLSGPDCHTRHYFCEELEFFID